MKRLTIRAMTLISLLMIGGTALAETAVSEKPVEEKGTSFAYGGDIYFALQNWSDVGMSGDSKLGYGLGGSFGVGVKIDDMTFLMGPHIAMSSWSADYSNKANSATDSVYVDMYDTGLQVSMMFDDVILSLGKGNSEISSGMIVNGSDIKYPYDGDKYDYSAVSIGFKMNYFMLGLGAVNYDGYGSHCDRAEFKLGMAF